MKRRRISLKARTVLVMLVLCMSGDMSRHSVSSFVPLSASRKRISRLGVTTTSSLESMTVKELRTLLKESNLALEKGTLSRLKRKQDLIDFLHENLSQQQQQQQQHHHVELTTPTESPQSSKFAIKEALQDGKDESQPRRRGTRGLGMAPLSEPMPPMEQSDSSKVTSRKGVFDNIYRRYPPLRTAVAWTKTVDEFDIRHMYHPILQNATSSDMDLVFVGTASCSPGITRGVSCTALRLNWNRRESVPNPMATDDENDEQSHRFVGGIWLFDVGECTQVRTIFTLSSLVLEATHRTKHEMLAPV